MIFCDIMESHIELYKVIHLPIRITRAHRGLKSKILKNIGTMSNSEKQPGKRGSQHDGNK